MKRIVLFLATNLAIMLVLSIVLSVLGVDPQSTGGLLVFALVFGMGGSFISLALSKTMAVRATGAQIIKEPRNSSERWLFDTVKRQAQAAGIGMPDIAIYESPDMNAFATGMKRNSALVAVSSGLMRSMSSDEVEAVLAHEVSHIANGDMVTLALIQGVVNTFVIFAARVIANVISAATNDEDGRGLGTFAYMGVVMVLEMVFGILASIIVAWFSRQREFRADAGSAEIEGPRKMIAALERLQQSQPSHLQGQLTAFGINSEKKSFSELFMSHPPLNQRIERLKTTARF